MVAPIETRLVRLASRLAEHGAGWLAKFIENKKEKKEKKKME